MIIATVDDIPVYRGGTVIPAQKISPTLWNEGKATEADMQMLGRFTKAINHHAKPPYSNFYVSAAVLVGDIEEKDGYVFRVFTGNNVENSSYGGTVCAERIGVFKAETEYPKFPDVYGLTVYTPIEAKTETDLTPPCGICRQIAVDFLPPQTPVYSFCKTEGLVLRTTMAEMLPNPFSAASMGLTTTNHSARASARLALDLGVPEDTVRHAKIIGGK